MSGRLFCRDCRYELTGLQAGAGGQHLCPECGHGYDPDDATSYLNAPRHPFWLFVFGKAGARCGIGLLLLGALMLSWIPRPLPLNPNRISNDWGLWVWFDKQYGVRKTGPPERTTSYWYWADAITAISSHPNDEPTDWRIKLLGDGRMRLDIDRPGTAYRGIVSAMRYLNTWPRYPIVLMGRQDIDKVFGELHVEGDWETVIAALANHFEFEFRGYLASEEQDHLYVMMPGDKRVRFISVAEAKSLGIEPRVVPASMGFRIGSPTR